MTRGFTLIEILITLGISAILFGAGTLVTIDAYKSSIFEREFNLFLDLLEKARSEAINNIQEEPHTLEINEEAYILDVEKYNRNRRIKISGPSKITFDNLSGQASPFSTFELTDGVRTKEISVEESGRLNW